jgi:hypothetical protein
MDRTLKKIRRIEAENNSEKSRKRKAATGPKINVK